jgi:hypothetical protein
MSANPNGQIHTPPVPPYKGTWISDNAGTMSTRETQPVDNV